MICTSDPNKDCEQCSEISKRPVGCWDGVDQNGRIISGFLYDCESKDCPIKWARTAEAEKDKLERYKVKVKNRENGIDIDLIREQARKTGITVYDMSKRLNLRPSEWCDRIYGRKAMEPGIAIRAMSEILAAKETQKDEFIRKAAVYEMLNELGGCDTADEWAKGWDKAIDTSIDSLEKMEGESL